MDQFNLKEYLKNNPLLKEETLVDTLMDKVKGMSSNEFKALASKAGDLEIWKSGGDIDGINNVDDRLETISQGFNNDDAKRYLDIISNLAENNPLLKENKSGAVKYLRDAFMSYLEGGDSFKNAPGKVEKIVWDKEEYGDPQNYNDAGGFMIALKALESSPISIQFPEYGKVSFTKKGNNIVGSFVVPKD